MVEHISDSIVAQPVLFERFKHCIKAKFSKGAGHAGIWRGVAVIERGLFF